MKHVQLFGALTCCLAALSLQSAEVTPEQAQTAVSNWIARDPGRLNSNFGSAEAEKVETARNASGRTLYHVVQLKGGGFVVTAGDTRLSPVVAFSGNGRYVASEESALYVLLQGDRAHALSVMDDYQARSDALPTAKGGSVFAKAESEWASLLKGATLAKSLTSSPSDLRVDKLLKTVWGQSYWGGNASNPGVFNYSTPNNYVCGCVATLGAQIMKFWERPSGRIAQFSNTCYVDGTALTKYSIDGTFDWANMPLSIATQPNPTETQKRAIGMLTYNLGVALGMSWTSGSSSAAVYNLTSVLKSRYGYSSATYVSYNLEVGASGWDNFKNALYSNLDAGMPVGLGIRRGSAGHAVIADGYGYSSGTLYTHINMGWAGIDDAWYNLWGENLPGPNGTYYTVVDEMLCNIHPNTTGDVVSGRVLSSVSAGTGLSGVTVALLNSSKTQVASTKSSAKGIYSFRVATPGQYYVRATSGSTTSSDVSVNMSSLSTSTRSGSKWGADVQIAVAPAGDEWDSGDDTASGGAWLTPTTSAQTHGPHSLSSTDLYDFFRVSMTAGVKYVLESTGGSDLIGELYNSISAAESSRVTSDDDGGEGSNFKIEYTPTTSQTYYLRVRKFNAGDASYSLKYSYIGGAGTYLRVEGYYPSVNCTLSSDAVNFMSKVDCDGSWTVSVDDTSWGVNLTTTSGVGDGYFYFSVPQNTGYDRHCVFTVKSGSLTAYKNLTQFGPLGERQSDTWDTGDDTATGGTWLTPTTSVQTHGPHVVSSTDVYDFFRISMTAGVTYVFESTGSSDMYGELFSSTSANSESCVASNDDDGDGNNFKIEYKPTKSQTYYLRVRKYNVGLASYSLKYSSTAAPQTYKVTFGKNGGTGGDSYVTATYGQPMPSSRTAPTLSGWTFAGYWDSVATDANGTPTGRQYYDASMKSVRNWDKKGAATLWAKWTNKVTLGKNGGTGGDAYVTCTRGQPMPKRTMPTKSGYAFLGYWTTTGAGGVKYYNADGTSAHAWDKSGSVTLWAKWVKPVACKVTFGKNGGSGGDNYVTATTGKAMPTPRTAPKRTGWTFAGYWDTLATDANGNPTGRQYYDSNMKSVRNWDGTSDTTLWAKWTVRVKLGKNGGTGGDDYVTVTYNQPFPKRAMPKRTGYTFGGYWVSSSSRTGQCYNPDGTGTSTMKWTMSGSPTIWALWTKTASCVELSASTVAEPASIMSAVADVAETAPAGMCSGVLADGSGSFWLVLDEPLDDAELTAFLCVLSVDGTLTAECTVCAAGDVIFLTTEDGDMYVVDLAEGIANQL